MSIRKVLLRWASVILLGGANSALGANLLANSGFENQGGGAATTAASWTLTRTPRVATCNTLTPASGSWFVCSNNNTNVRTAVQVIPVGSVPAIGTPLGFSFKYARATTTVPTIAWAITGGATASGSVTNAGTTWQTLPQQIVTVTSPAAITITFTITGTGTPIPRAGLDDVVLEETPTACRILSLTSNAVVSPPGSVLLWHRGLLGDSERHQLQRGPQEGGERGRLYRQWTDLQRRPVSDTDGPTLQQRNHRAVLPYQNAFTTPTASITNLNGLILGTATGPSGTTISLGSGTYTYSGTPFQSPHTGTYKATRDCTTVPEPGTFVLMLLPLAGLRAIRRRWQHA